MESRILFDYMLIPVVSSYFLLFSILLGLLCCLCSPTKTLLHSGNVEDWPLLGSCCSSFLSGFASDRKIVPRIQGNLSSRNVELMQCVNSTAAVSNARILKRMLPAPRLLVGVVTYASSDIWDYAAIAAAVNQKYSGLRGYLFFVLDEHSRNFEPRDQRWNKVKILHQVFDNYYFC